MTNQTSQATKASQPAKATTPPLWLLAELTYQCPLHCPYCSNPVNMEETFNELSTSQWKKA